MELRRAACWGIVRAMFGNILTIFIHFLFEAFKFFVFLVDEIRQPFLFCSFGALQLALKRLDFALQLRIASQDDPVHREQKQMNAGAYQSSGEGKSREVEAARR